MLGVANNNTGGTLYSTVLKTLFVYANQKDSCQVDWGWREISKYFNQKQANFASSGYDFHHSTKNELMVE